jgi:hypothetical protein
MSNGAAPTVTSRMNVKICLAGIPLVFKDFQMARNCRMRGCFFPPINIDE